MSPDTVSALMRALGLGALLQAMGVSIFLVAFGHLLADSRAAIRCAGFVSALAALPLLVGQYVVEAARMADDWSGILDAGLQGMVLKSPASVVLVLRIIGLLAIGISMRPAARARPIETLVGSLAVSVSFAMTGHTAVHSSRWLLAPLLLTHVLIVAFWLGALAPLYLASRRESPERAGTLVRAFTKAATPLVPVIALAGVLMAWVLVPDLAVFHHVYGALLIGKIAGFSVLMGFAAANKWRFGPAIAASGVVGRWFRRSLAMEYALIMAVLTATTVMTTFFSPDAAAGKPVPAVALDYPDRPRGTWRCSRQAPMSATRSERLSDYLGQNSRGR